MSQPVATTSLLLRVLRARPARHGWEKLGPALALSRAGVGGGLPDAQWRVRRGRFEEPPCEAGRGLWGGSSARVRGGRREAAGSGIQPRHVTITAAAPGAKAGAGGTGTVTSPAPPPQATTSAAPSSVLAACFLHGDAPAFLSPSEAPVSFASLLLAASSLARTLHRSLPPNYAPPLAASALRPGVSVGPRVGVMLGPSPGFTAAVLAVWMCGGVVVPLALSHPPAELAYVLSDSEVSAVIASAAYTSVLEPLTAQAAIPLIPSHESLTSAPSHENGAPTTEEGGPDGVELPGAEAAALFVYTSGTTGRPKGAVHSHGSLTAQVRALLDAWHWSPHDVILHSLPLHHVHGFINALLCPLFIGAAVEFLPRFSPTAIWSRWIESAQLLDQQPGFDKTASRPLTVFMGVPTMYVRLLQAFDAMKPEEQKQAAAAAAKHRLMVSGSAACPMPVMARWEAVSGYRLLERYGMTEVGMALSNPLLAPRRPGYVGLPLPGVEARIAASPPGADDQTGAGGDGAVAEDEGGVAARVEAGDVDVAASGELLIRGANVFCGYWGRVEATQEAFDAEGFFLTGDVAAVGHDGWYRILGRSSVDIIKSAGYKLSALEIEAALLEHPLIAECAVIGLPSSDMGETVAAVIVAAQGGSNAASSDPKLALTPTNLVQWSRGVLAPYKIPRTWKQIDAIPRNAMGKVNKKALRKALFAI